MVNAVRAIVWIAAPFGLTLLIALTFVAGRGSPEEVSHETSQRAESRLVGRTISEAFLVEARSRAPVVEQNITLPDTAVVILLGAIGCARNQRQVLQHWAEQPRNPVLAIYADYMMSQAAASHEALILRRVSQVAIPFLVSSDTTLSPRAMGISTPQVVRVESGVITEVLELLPGSPVVTLP